jgi:hypothetical protein
MRKSSPSDLYSVPMADVAAEPPRIVVWSDYI